MITVSESSGDIKVIRFQVNQIESQVNINGTDIKELKARE